MGDSGCTLLLAAKNGLPVNPSSVYLAHRFGPQGAAQALKIAHRGYVLVNGLITMSGSGAELLARPEVRAAYLEGGRQA